MPKYLLLKHYRGGPEPHHPFLPMDQWAPEDVEAHMAFQRHVNELLQEAQGANPSPRSSGTLHYAAQVGTRPPSFVLFGGGRAPGPGYRRYLENRFREAFHLEGVPIKMRFRPRTRGRSR